MGTTSKIILSSLITFFGMVILWTVFWVYSVEGFGIFYRNKINPPVGIVNVVSIYQGIIYNKNELVIYSNLYNLLLLYVSALMLFIMIYRYRYGVLISSLVASVLSVSFGIIYIMNTALYVDNVPSVWYSANLKQHVLWPMVATFISFILSTSIIKKILPARPLATPKRRTFQMLIKGLRTWAFVMVLASCGERGPTKADLESAVGDRVDSFKCEKEKDRPTYFCTYKTGIFVVDRRIVKTSEGWERR